MRHNFKVGDKVEHIPTGVAGFISGYKSMFHKDKASLLDRDGELWIHSGVDDCEHQLICGEPDKFRLVTAKRTPIQEAILLLAKANGLRLRRG